MNYKPLRGIQRNRTHSLAKGLVSVWMMNEASGNTIFDLSGHNNNGTLSGGIPSWVADGLDFDGVNEYINIGSINGQIIGTNPRTITIKFTADAFGAGTEKTLFTYCDGTPGKGLWLFAEDGAISIAFNAHRVITPKTKLLVGETHTVSLVVPNGATHTANTLVYIDGVNQTLADEAGASQILNTNVSDIKIGCDEATLNHYDGKIIFASIHNRELLSNEITTFHRDPYLIFKSYIESVLSGYLTTEGGSALMVMMT